MLGAWLTCLIEIGLLGMPFNKRLRGVLTR